MWTTVVAGSLIALSANAAAQPVPPAPPPAAEPELVERTRWSFEGGAVFGQPGGDLDQEHLSFGYSVAIGVRLADYVGIFGIHRRLAISTDRNVGDRYPYSLHSSDLALGLRYQRLVSPSVALFGEGSLGTTAFEIDLKHPDSGGPVSHWGFLLGARAGVIVTVGRWPTLGIGAALGYTTATVTPRDATFMRDFGDTFRDAWQMLEVFAHVGL